MKKFRIGKKCDITEKTKERLFLPDGVEYVIKDILKEDVECPIVLGAEELGKDWVQFFTFDELIVL